MSSQRSLIYDYPVAKLLPAAADAAGRTGSYLSLRNALKAFVEVEVNQGNAATVALTLLQAKDSSGTGAKALTGGVEAYLYNAAGTSDTKTNLGYVVNYTTDATLADKLVIFAVSVDSLDIANGFNHITVQTGASNAANITAANLRVAPSYAGDSAPSAFV
jgi:hypothetical protein